MIQIFSIQFNIKALDFPDGPLFKAILVQFVHVHVIITVIIVIITFISQYDDH